MGGSCPEAGGQLWPFVWQAAFQAAWQSTAEPEKFVAYRKRRAGQPACSQDCVPHFANQNAARHVCHHWRCGWNPESSQRSAVG